ncbi:hypothetical protein O0L34_g16336 [Tuta absoluta]|nr:hypothetical protein O0L34_g16336 [Tuta absoluta]
MESTDSVSKGVFLFGKKTVDNKYTSKHAKHTKKPLERRLTDQLWYITYKRSWNSIQNKLKDLHHQLYDELLSAIVGYISSYNEEAVEGTIPSAALLTGVNQPDHTSQFTALVDKIRQDVTPHVAMVTSQDGSTLKYLVENAVWQLIDTNEDYGNDSDCEELPLGGKKLKKNHCTMKTLQRWYNALYRNSPKKKAHSQTPLVIIFPDFECFNPSILQDFIMIASSYTSSLPIVLVFGVATTVSALHKCLPYTVSAKLHIRVFHSIPSHVLMNYVVDTIFLTHESPVHLSGKVLQYLSDVFLFYDFSVSGLVEGIKYCIMEHYYGDDIKSLCCERDTLKDAVKNLSTEDLEDIRHLLSIRQYVEAQDSETIIRLFEDDQFFKDVVLRELNKLHDYYYSFYACLRLLYAFVSVLPQGPLGKTLRELYIKCSTNLITSTPEFSECMLLLGFQSQQKLVETIKNSLHFLNQSLPKPSTKKPLRTSPLKNHMDNSTVKNDLGECFVEFVRIQLQLFVKQLENASAEVTVARQNYSDVEDENIPGNRYRLKEKLLQSTRQDRIQSEFEMVRSRFISYLHEMFAVGLQQPHTRPFHEVLQFHDLAAVKKQVVGSPRGAQHTALANPQLYLQCKCCVLPTAESMTDTLPDASLAYKLHRECGKHINLYDWLQAFAAVLRPEQEPSARHTAPVQARFSQAVSALHFLGFIKSSKRKTDHVMRLTW